MMHARRFCFFFYLLTSGLCLGQEEIIPADAYPLEHYQEIWRKNPFTLKTAPAAIRKESFARDLVLGSMVQFGKETVVVVVNTKTRERTELVSGQPAANGMTLKAAHLKEERKDSFVEIEMKGDSAKLHYDEAFQKQLATNGAASTASRNAVAANNKTSNGDDETLRARRRRDTTPR